MNNEEKTYWGYCCGGMCSGCVVRRGLECAGSHEDSAERVPSAHLQQEHHVTGHFLNFQLFLHLTRYIFRETQMCILPAKFYSVSAGTKDDFCFLEFGYNSCQKCTHNHTGSKVFIIFNSM